MPESISYTSGRFTLESVTLVAPASLRVRFTFPPNQSNPAGAHDALNVSLYGLTGPMLISILSAATDPSDVQSVFLTLNAPLVGGSWTLTASTAIQTPASVALTSPTYIVFTVAPAATPQVVNPGAGDTEPQDFLRQFLSTALQGQGWTAMVAALASGDTTNWDNVESVFDQLFISSAGGRFLDRKLSDDGIRRPPGMGLDDQLFSRLGISIRNNQLTQEAFLEALEIFYGTDAVRAYAESSVAEPYAIFGGEQLLLLVDGIDTIPITFQDANFTLVGGATALEVAVAITEGIRATGTSQAFAIPYADPNTGANMVRVYSGSIGLRSSIAISGGQAQNILQFPEPLNIFTSPPSPSSLIWDVNNTSLLPAQPPGVMRVYSVTSSPVTLSAVRPGDYVNIFGANFNAANLGSFPVTNVFVGYQSTTITSGSNGVNLPTGTIDVASTAYFAPGGGTIIVQTSAGAQTVTYGGVSGTSFTTCSGGTGTMSTGGVITASVETQYFDVQNFGSVAQNGVTEVTLNDVTFWRPQKSTIQQGSRTVLVAQATENICEVILPATTAAVTRGVDTAAYLHSPSPLGLDFTHPITRAATGVVTVTTASPHGFIASATPAPSPLSGFLPTTPAQIFVDDVTPSLAVPVSVAGNEQSPTVPGNTDANPLSQFSNIRHGDTVSGSTYGQSALLSPLVAIQTGGDTGSGNSTSHCQSFVLTAPPAVEANTGLSWTYNWGTVLALPVALERHALLIPTQGNNYGGAVVIGGVTLVSGSPTGFSSSVYSSIPLAPAPTSWATQTAVLSVARCSLTATLLANGTGVVAGGATAVNTAAVSTVDYLDVNQATLTSTPSLLTARAEHQAVAVTTPGGTSGVLVIGGRALAQTAVLDTLVLGLWHMDESSGSSVADSSGNGYNLTAVNTTVSTAGKILNARNFEASSGTGTMTAAGNATAYNTLYGPWTIEAWVTGIQTGSSGAVQTVLSYGNTTTLGTGNVLAELDVIYTSGSPATITLQVVWQYGTSSVTTVTTQSVPATYVTTTWHHVAVTKTTNAVTPTLYDLQFYLDGQPLGPPTTGLVDANTGTSSEWNLGNNAAGSTGFQGILDDVRISGATAAPYLSLLSYGYTRSPTDIFNTWLRGRGDLLTAGNGQLRASTELFLQGASAWVTAGRMTLARSGHTATVLPDGRVLVTGGYAYKDGEAFVPTGPTGVASPTNSCEVWDPYAQVWHDAGHMSSPRADHQAVYLPASGRVLVFGGFKDASGDTAPTTFEYWDPVTGKWVLGPPTTWPEVSSSPVVPQVTNQAVLMTPLGVVWPSGGQGLVYVEASDQLSGGGLTGWQSVASVVSTTMFQYVTPAYRQYTVNGSDTTEVTLFAANPSASVPGPYIWDPTGTSAAITSTQDTTAVTLYKGRQYSQLQLTDAVATDFPNEPGYLVLNFGSDQAVFPVPYLGVFSANTLALDYNFVFPFTVPAGSTVILLAQKGPWVPPIPEAVGSFYLTDSNSGRVAAEATVENIAAGGEDVDITVSYPGDRGLGGEGLPAMGQKFSEKVIVWGSNDLDVDEADARLGINLQVDVIDTSSEDENED